MAITVSPLRPFTVTGVISSLNAPDSVAALARFHAGGGKRILRLACEVVLLGTLFTEGAHRAARLVGIFQTVEHHVVVNAVMGQCERRCDP